MALVAFSVSDGEDSEGRGCILFAKSNIEARRKGANVLDCDGIGGLTCRRATWADEFAAVGSVPAAVMIANGWWLECCGCQQMINDGGTVSRWIQNEAGEDVETEVDVEPVGSQFSAFCTPECRDREMWRRAWAKRGDRRCFEVFKRELLRQYPEVTIDPEKSSDERWSDHHHRYFGRHSKSGLGRALCFVVCFSFPGAKYGGSYRYDLDYGAMRGKRQILIANHDQEAWRVFCAGMSSGRPTSSEAA